jgi:molybdopterin/thiamine biosynthesis adenylyltransferase
MNRSARPRRKAAFPVYAIDETIYIQGCGDLIEIEDAEGHVRRLLDLLDGTRTADEVADELVREGAAPSREDVFDAIAALERQSLLEDAARDRLDDPYFLERWSRNLGFFETYATLETSKYELQQRLQDARVGLLGLGGVGTHASLDLAAMGVGDLRILDFDTVELSNLNRQILYTEADIGRRKVELAEARIRAFAPRLRLDAVEQRLSSADDVAEAVHDRDVVIGAIDRPKMQAAGWLNEGCVRAGVPLITGGVDTQRSLHYTILPGETGCVECWRQAAAQDDPVGAAISEQMADIERRQIAGERFGQDFAAFAPVVMLHTAYMVGEAARIITGIAPPIAAGRLLEVRFDDFALREAERWERLPDCPVCGEVSERRDRSPLLVGQEE